MCFCHTFVQVSLSDTPCYSLLFAPQSIISNCFICMAYLRISWTGVWCFLSVYDQTQCPNGLERLSPLLGDWRIQIQWPKDLYLSLPSLVLDIIRTWQGLVGLVLGWLQHETSVHEMAFIIVFFINVQSFTSHRGEASNHVTVNLYILQAGLGGMVLLELLLETSYSNDCWNKVILNQSSENVSTT